MANNLSFDVKFKIKDRSAINNNKNIIIKDTNNTNNNSSCELKNAFFIEGGGTRGIYAIGVLRYLFQNNPYITIDKIDIFGGTSVGSYLAAALSFGYDSNDLISVSKIIDLSELVDHKYLFVLSACRFASNGYLYNSNGRKNIIVKILEHKIDKIREHLNMPNINALDLTFGHLKKLIDLYPLIYKHLIFNSVDINRSEQIFMTTLNDKWDSLKILDGLMASSAIPGIFNHSDFYYYPSTDCYGYDKNDEAQSVWFIDGGIDTNNPIDYFLLNYNIYHNYTIWLLKFNGKEQYVKLDGIISYFKQIIEYLVSGKNNIKYDLVEENYHINTINLHSKGSTLTIYSKEETEKIIDQIYQKCVDGELFFGN